MSPGELIDLLSTSEPIQLPAPTRPCSPTALFNRQISSNEPSTPPLSPPFTLLLLPLSIPPQARDDRILTPLTDSNAPDLLHPPLPRYPLSGMDRSATQEGTLRDEEAEAHPAPPRGVFVKGSGEYFFCGLSEVLIRDNSSLQWKHPLQTRPPTCSQT